MPHSRRSDTRTILCPQGLSLLDMYLEPLRIDGTKHQFVIGQELVLISIVTFRISDEEPPLTDVSIYESSNSIRMDIPTYTSLFSIPQHVSRLRIADTLKEHFIKNGKLSGDMVTQIIKNRIAMEQEPYST